MTKLVLMILVLNMSESKKV